MVPTLFTKLAPLAMNPERHSQAEYDKSFPPAPEGMEWWTDRVRAVKPLRAADMLDDFEDLLIRQTFKSKRVPDLDTLAICEHGKCPDGWYSVSMRIAVPKAAA